MVQKQTFSKRFLRETLCGDTEAKVVEKNFVEQGRWAVTYEMVFEHDGKHYQVAYEEGVTELQGQAPFEYDLEQIEVIQVEKVEVVKHEWRPVGEKSDGS